MAVQTNNLRRLIVLYWRHSTEDRENSWTKELYEALIYDEKLRLRSRNDTEFVFANTNRKTESYLISSDLVEYYRRHKFRGEPLVIMELTFPNENGSREEMLSIENRYRMEQALKRIHYWVNEYQR